MMNLTENIKGKVVVITGASSGLGAETARHLARAGAKLMLGARRHARLKELAEQLELPKEAAFTVDVTDRRQVQAFVDRAADLYGHIDVMMNNAGIGAFGPFEERQLDEWDRCVDVNIKGVLWGIAAALPYFKAQNSGQFINVASVAGHAIIPGLSVYSATKHCVRILSEALRQEVKPYNIRTTILSPGAVTSEIVPAIDAQAGAAGITEASRKFAEAHSSKAISADNFARCVLFAIGQPKEVDINEILFRPTIEKT